MHLAANSSEIQSSRALDHDSRIPAPDADFRQGELAVRARASDAGVLRKTLRPWPGFESRFTEQNSMAVMPPLRHFLPRGGAQAMELVARPPRIHALEIRSTQFVFGTVHQADPPPCKSLWPPLGAGEMEIAAVSPRTKPPDRWHHQIKGGSQTGLNGRLSSDSCPVMLVVMGLCFLRSRVPASTSRV